MPNQWPPVSGTHHVLTNLIPTVLLSLMSAAALSILAIIPPEITEHALSLCRLRDVVSFSETCRIAYRLVYHPPPPHLWRSLFLATFDDPRKALHINQKSGFNDVYDWKGVLIRRFQAAQVARGRDLPDLSRKEVIQTFLSAIQDVPPLLDRVEDDPSLNLMWLSRTLRKSQIIMTHENWSDEPQLESQLRAHVALGIDSVDQRESKLRSAFSRLRSRRTASRCYVYDLRHYSEGNHYGPFLNGLTRRVDWVHVEALMNVVQSNIREIPHQWAKDVCPPVQLEFLRAHSAPGDKIPNDWAGVEGSWARYVCFMDYRELFAFNFTSMYGGPRNPLYFEDPSFREATRLIRLELHLTPPEKLKFRGLTDYDAVHDNEAGAPISDPRYPTLYFSGLSHGARGSEAAIEGNVRMGADGSPLWRFVSIYNGQTQWSSEGVQIGHVSSAMGVVGVWTSDSHDEGDPAGPFWFWKPTQSLDDIDDFI